MAYERKWSATHSLMKMWGPPENSCPVSLVLIIAIFLCLPISQIGLVHGRGFARNEVGLAAINLTSCELHLCQMTDSHGFIKTVAKMNLFRPTEVRTTMNYSYPPSKLDD